MGIPVLCNPFGAERSTRQRLLNAVQQTGDYIMSQQVLMTASTLATKTLFCSQCHELKNAPWYMLFITVLLVVETRHFHTEVSPSENGPPEWFWEALAEIGPSRLNTVVSDRHSEEEMRRGMTWQPLLLCSIHNLCSKLYKVTEKGNKVGNNGLVGGGGGNCFQNAYPWATKVCIPYHAMLSKYYTHSSLPWCRGQASSKSGRGGPAWGVQPQNNKTIRSDRVTWNKCWQPDSTWQQPTITDMVIVSLWTSLKLNSSGSPECSHGQTVWTSTQLHINTSKYGEITLQKSLWSLLF